MAWLKAGGRHAGRVIEITELRATADKMLEMLDRLADIERRKAEIEEVGSAPFVELAAEAEALAQVVFRWSQLQLQQAIAATLVPREERAVRLADIQPRRLDVILADWRQAQVRLDAARPGTPEALRAADDVERLRTEYRAAQRDKQ
jgi:hypothetical protein